MPSTMRNTVESSRSNSLDSIRPEPLKAHLPDQSSQLPLTALLPEALRRANCSQKEAAIAMGIDPAQASRQIAGGSLTAARIDALPQPVKAELFKLAAEEYGTLVRPKAFGHRLLTEIEDRLSQVRQLIDQEVA